MNNIAYKLDEHRHNSVLESLKRDITYKKKPVEKPILIFVSGQPGTGTSSIIAIAANSFPDGNVVIINQEEFRRNHPNSKEILIKYDKDYARLTDPDVCKWTEKMFHFAKQQHYNIIFQGGLCSTEVCGTMNSFRQEGYHIFFRIAAENELESRAALYQKYEAQMNICGAGNFTERSSHDKIYDDLLSMLQKLEVEGQADTLGIYQRTGKEIFLPNQKDGKLDLVDIVIKARNQPWNLGKYQEYVKQCQAVIASMEKRGEPREYVDDVKHLVEKARTMIHYPQRSYDRGKRKVHIMLVFAGPEGSGKTTMVNEYYDRYDLPERYVCESLIQKEKRLGLKEAIVEAQRQQKAALENRESLVVETGMGTSEQIDLLRLAKGWGYYVELIYITTQNPIINQERIKQRQLELGEDTLVDMNSIQWDQSMKFLWQAVEVVDIAKVYDNSFVTCQLIAEKVLERAVQLHSHSKYHNWIQRYFEEPIDKKTTIYKLSPISCSLTAGCAQMNQADQNGQEVALQTIFEKLQIRLETLNQETSLLEEQQKAVDGLPLSPSQAKQIAISQYCEYRDISLARELCELEVDRTKIAEIEEVHLKLKPRFYDLLKKREYYKQGEFLHKQRTELEKREELLQVEQQQLTALLETTAAQAETKRLSFEMLSKDDLRMDKLQLITYRLNSSITERVAVNNLKACISLYPEAMDQKIQISGSVENIDNLLRQAQYILVQAKEIGQRIQKSESE